MQYEVEQKLRIDDVGDFVARLTARGVTIGPAIDQRDQYFAHPCRDFAQTDEALRIRTVRGESFVTYKGPKVDQTTKTRRELELPLNSGDADGSEFFKLLSALGFKPVAVVNKRRRSFQIRYDGCDVEGALDEVEGLGSFVELELMAGDDDVDTAKRVVAALAGELQTGPVERCSYLELLLERVGKTQGK